jgi:F-type H+-transporting ATPase subunit epsilon
VELVIISHKDIIYKADSVLSVSLPTETGEIQILKDHADLITVLNQGVIFVKQHDNQKKILISSGFAQIQSNKIVILADDADLPENIVKEELDKAIQRAEKEIANSHLSPAELIQLEKQLRYQRFKREVE